MEVWVWHQRPAEGHMGILKSWATCSTHLVVLNKTWPAGCPTCIRIWFFRIWKTSMGAWSWRWRPAEGNMGIYPEIPSNLWCSPCSSLIMTWMYSVRSDLVLPDTGWYSLHKLLLLLLGYLLGYLSTSMYSSRVIKSTTMEFGSKRESMRRCLSARWYTTEFWNIRYSRFHDLVGFSWSGPISKIPNLAVYIMKLTSNFAPFPLDPQPPPFPPSTLVSDKL